MTGPGAIAPAREDNDGMAARTGQQPDGADRARGKRACRAASGPGPAGQRPKARELNELIRYTMWSVFRVSDGKELAAAARRRRRSGRVAIEVSELLGQAAGKGIVTRGCYDIQGLRADADYMFWWVAPTADDLQEMYARFRRHRLGRASEPVWSAMALHRPAEFNKSHVPAFLAGEEPGATSASTRSSGPTSGTCSTTTSAGPCWPSTGRWPASTPTCGPTPWPASR